MPGAHASGQYIMSMTVKEVLALKGLEVMVLKAGANHIHRKVRWYYVAENEGIDGWVMGGELVFVTGINYPRDEENLLQMLREGYQHGIAGMVILTGEAFIHEIPSVVIELADELGIPLVEQPYSLKMVIVTHLIGTALVQRATALRSKRDLLTQLLTGEYPSLDIAHQRAQHLQLALDTPRHVVALRLCGVQALFDERVPEQAEERLQMARQRVQQHLEESLIALGEETPLIILGELFILLLPSEERGFHQGKQWLQHIQHTANQFTAPLKLFCGISTAIKSSAQLSQGLLEARRALDIAESTRSDLGQCDYSELGVLKLLSAVSDPGLVTQFMKETLGRLYEPYRKHPYLLIDTLDAVLQENGNLLKAAERLNIHRNTLHQRVQRIEQQTEQSLGDAQFRLNALVALLIWRMSNAQQKQELS